MSLIVDVAAHGRCYSYFEVYIGKKMTGESIHHSEQSSKTCEHETYIEKFTGLNP